MKTRMKTIRWWLVGFSLLGVATGSWGATLSVPLIPQEQNQWCWNASARMCMRYLVPGFTDSQTDIADWAVEGLNDPNVFDFDGTNNTFMVTPAHLIRRRGVKQVLEHFGELQSTIFSSSLTTSQLQAEIDSSRPVIIAVGWFSANKRVGGHAVVIRGFDGTTVDINDPWPTTGAFSIIYTSLTGGPAGTYRPGSSAHSWQESLTIANSLDVVFLIDSTGSMRDDIANVKSKVNTIIDNIANKFKDYRIGVVDYRDYPVDPWGDPGDFITRAQTSFALKNAAAAKTGINALSARGGNDEPEAVWSAVNNCLDGTILGGWRTKPTQRKIIVIGDAPGHDPEPWSGGLNSSAVLAKANSADLPIQVHTLLVGGDIDAAATFDLLAGATGGSAWMAGNASEVGNALVSIVDEIAENPRFPREEVANALPTFSFTLPTMGMLNSASQYYLQLESFDTRTGAWKKNQQAKLNADSVTWTPKKPLPTSDYRWKLTFNLPSFTLMLPDGTTSKVRGGKGEEAEWTGFERLIALPGNPGNLYPDPYGFGTSEGTVVYSWTKAAAATRHAIRIYRNGVLWKKAIVKEPKVSDTDVRTFRVRGHVAGAIYRWHVQGLNYDRPKATEVSGDWTPPLP